MLISPSPLSLTTHRRHLRIVPPHLVHRFASRTFLVLLANLIDISQFLTPSATLPSPRPFLSPRPQGLLSFHLLEGGGRSLRVRPQNRRARGRGGAVGGPLIGQRGGEASSFPPIALPRAAAAAAAAWGSAGARRCLRELCVRVANIYLHIVLHVTIMYAPG